MNMDGSASKHSKPGGNSTRVGLVKTAANMYGNRIADVNGPLLREEFSTVCAHYFSSTCSYQTNTQEQKL